MQQIPTFIPDPDIAPTPAIYKKDAAAFRKTLSPEDPYYDTPTDHPDFKWKTHYKNNYLAIFRRIALQETDPDPKYPDASPEHYAKSMIRSLIKTDLFFIAYFIMDIPVVNGVYAVSCINEIESLTPDGGLSLNRNLFIWAREHLKSTTLTKALTIKRIVNNPDCCTLIFSHGKDAANKFLGSIRDTLETEIMLECFPDVLYEKPETQSPSWSLQNGIRVKRKSVSRNENTVEASGLVEGMKTGGHFDHLMYDDVETFDTAKSPDQMNLCYDAFDMSGNLGKDGCTRNVIGTFYSHLGPLVRIRNKKDIHGNPMFKTSVRAATHDGTRHGRPVFLSQERLDELKTSKYFDSQQLCNPTPVDIAKLDSRMLKYIDPHFLPKDRFKFIIIDQAGGKDTNISGKKGDSWTIGLVSVKPVIDELGTSDVYLEEFETGEMTHAQAINSIIQMYLRSGLVRAIGVEKVGLSTTEIHVADALRAHGRILSEKNKTLILLRPGGRSTEERVEAALEWSLCNGKIFVSTAIAEEERQALITEMDLFPFYHPDIINMLAYAYDIIKEYKFPTEDRPKRVSVGEMMAVHRIRPEL